MKQPTIMAIIIPSYGCNNHCNYCMYHDWTFNSQHQTVDSIVKTLLKLQKNITFYGYAIGGGGDILSLGYEYCECLIRNVKDIMQTKTVITLMTNIHNVDDVVFLSRMMDDYNVHLNVSLNFERPNNNQTIELIKKFDQAHRFKIRIATVVLNSVIQYGCRKYLELIDSLGVESLMVNQFEKTIMTKICQYPTDYQYFQFLYQCIELYIRNRSSFNFDLPQARDLLVSHGSCGIVDVIIDPTSVKISTFNNRRVKYLKTVDNIEKTGETINSTAHRLFDSQCLTCKHLYTCEHKYTQSVLDPRVCNLMDGLISLVNDHMALEI